MGDDHGQKFAPPSLLGGGDEDTFEFKPLDVPDIDDVLKRAEAALKPPAPEQTHAPVAKRRRLVPCLWCGNPRCTGTRWVED